jgi:hypothetical protein
MRQDGKKDQFQRIRNHRDEIFFKKMTHHVRIRDAIAILFMKATWQPAEILHACH